MSKFTVRHILLKGIPLRDSVDMDVYLGERMSHKCIGRWFYHECGDCSFSCRDRVVGVYHKGKIVGLFRYQVHMGWIQAYGTYIRPCYRKKGLARRMWECALNRYNPGYVEVTTVSKEGAYLVDSLQAKYPKVSFRHTKFISQ